MTGNKHIFFLGLNTLPNIHITDTFLDSHPIIMVEIFRDSHTVQDIKSKWFIRLETIYPILEYVSSTAKIIGDPADEYVENREVRGNGNSRCNAKNLNRNMVIKPIQ